MALVTLPYPNMDFVPLDVLTANELDQIVANIEAVNNAQITSAQLSNGSVSTVKIADSAVSADKIDWASLGSKSTSGSTQVAITTSATTVLSLSLDAGTWFLIGTSDFNHANTDTGDCFVGFDNTSDSTQVGQRFYFNEKADGTYWSACSATATVTLSATKTIAFVAKKGQGTLNAMRTQFTAIRIA